MNRVPGVVLLALFGCQVEDVVAEIAATSAEGSDGCGGLELLPVLRDRWRQSAACVCEDAAVSATFLVQEGTVAVDGSLAISDRYQAEGTAVVGSVRAGGSSASISGPLRVGADWLGDGALVVNGDAAVGGDLRASDLTVSGRLVQPPGADRTVSGSEAVGRFEPGPVSVEPSCACRQVRQWLSTALDGFDEAEPGWRDPTRSASLTLSCSTTVLERIELRTLRVEVEVAATLVVRTALLVEDLSVSLAPGAVLELFVGQSLSVNGRLNVQDGVLRVFSAAGGTLRLPSQLQGVVFLAAPRAELVAPDGLRATGGFLIRRLATSGPIHFTRATQ